MEKQGVAILGDSFISGNIYGVQRFAYEILRELDNMDLPIKIVIVVPQFAKVEVQFNNFEIVRYGNIKNPFLWRQICFPVFIKKNNYIGVDMTLGLPYFKCDIVCLHDCTYENFKDNFKTIKEKLRRKSYLVRAKHLIKKSKAIITVSETSKTELVKYYKVRSEKIYVIYNAWQHYNRIKEDDSIFEKIGINKSEKFFFSLGSGLAHKNILWIVRAAIKNPDYKFVITGTDKFSSYYESIGIDSVKNVIYTGYIPDAQVKALMKNANAFIHPAFCEGFGIPPLEALSTGTKIMVSNTSCLPEIYEKSAIYIDPYQYDIHIDEIIKENVDIDNIKYILDKYSWKKSAEKFAKILEELL